MQHKLSPGLITARAADRGTEYPKVSNGKEAPVAGNVLEPRNPQEDENIQFSLLYLAFLATAL